MTRFVTFFLALALMVLECVVLELFGVTSVSLQMGIIVAVYLGVRAIQKELEDKTVFTVLTKPVARPAFVVGKYAGAFATITVTLSIIVGLKLIAASIAGFEIRTIHFVAYYGVLLQLAIVTAVAVLFASFSSTLLSSLFSFGIFVAGSLTPQLREAVQHFAEKDSPARYVAEFAVFVLPDLEKLNLSFELTHDLSVPTNYLVDATGYSVVYIGLLLYVASLIFSRRDFS